jgi:hypothetical protein
VNRATYALVAHVQDSCRAPRVCTDFKLPERSAARAWGTVRAPSSLGAQQHANSSPNRVDRPFPAMSESSESLRAAHDSRFFTRLLRVTERDATEVLVTFLWLILS